MANSTLLEPLIRGGCAARAGGMTLTGRLVSSICQDSLQRRFARGAFWSLVGAAIAQGLSLAATILTARLLGKESFGELGMIQSTVGMLGVFSGLGLGLTATRYVAQFRHIQQERAARIIVLTSLLAFVMGVAMTVTVFASASVLAARTMNAPHLTWELRIASGLLLFNAVSGAQTGALSGFEAFKTVARVNLWRGLLSFPLAIGGVVFWGLRGAVASLVLTAAAGCFMNQLALNRLCLALKTRVRLAQAWTERRILWSFSLPAFLSSAMVSPVVWVANAILVNQAGGYGEMGILSAATQWRSAVMFLPGVLAQSALPMLSNLHGETNVAQYKRMLHWNLIGTALVATLLVLPIVFSAPLIMRSYGPGFATGSLVLVLSVLSGDIASINNVIGSAIASAGSMWIGFGFNTLWAMAMLGGSLLAVPKYFAMGFAGTLLLAYIAHTCWQTAYLHHVLRRAAQAVPTRAH